MIVDVIYEVGTAGAVPVSGQNRTMVKLTSFGDL